MGLRFYLNVLIFFGRSFSDLDDSILIYVVLVDLFSRLGLPDEHGQLSSLVGQLVVDVHIVLGEILVAGRVLTSPHTFCEDLPGKPSCLLARRMTKAWLSFFFPIGWQAMMSFFSTTTLL